MEKNERNLQKKRNVLKARIDYHVSALEEMRVLELTELRSYLMLDIALQHLIAKLEYIDHLLSR